MKRALIIPGLLALGVVTAAGGRPATDPEVPSWNVDAAHTEISFSVRHFFTPVSGRFENYDVRLDFDPANPAEGSVEVRIDVASVNTGNTKRDNHLRSADWFEAETYPHIVFQSTSVRQVAPNRLLATGELTIKDVTKEVEMPITLLGVKDIPGPMQEMLGGVKQVASFQAETALDRREFGVGVGSWAETMVVGGDVEIEIAVEANRS